MLPYPDRPLAHPTPTRPALNHPVIAGHGQVMRCHTGALAYKWPLPDEIPPDVVPSGPVTVAPAPVQSLLWPPALARPCRRGSPR